MISIINWAFSWIIRVFTKQATVNTDFAPTLEAITNVTDDIRSGKITYIPGRGYIDTVEEAPISAARATLIKSLTMSLSKDLLRSNTVQPSIGTVKPEGENDEENQTVQK